LTIPAQMVDHLVGYGGQRRRARVTTSQASTAPGNVTTDSEPLVAALGRS